MCESVNTPPVDRRRRRAFCATAALAVASSGASHAAIDPETRGAIRFDGLRVGAAHSLWHLYGRAEVRLSPAIRAGLDNGVPLDFVLDVALHEARSFWFDRTVLELERRSTLVYYDLTGHYRLQVEPVERRVGVDWASPPTSHVAASARRVARSQSRNFRSLKQALDSLGDVRALPLVVVDAVHPPREALSATVRLRLDDRALPLPLQPIFDSTWRLSSGERRWRLWTPRAG